MNETTGGVFLEESSVNAIFMAVAVVTGLIILPPQAASAPYCASVSYKTGKVSGQSGSVKFIAAKKAIGGWEVAARRKFNEPTITWSRAKRKSIKYRHITTGIVKAHATGTVCVRAANKPNRANRKCPPNDFKCKANQAFYKKKFSKTPDGIKGGLNPQPEPPSRVKVWGRQ